MILTYDIETCGLTKNIICGSLSYNKNGKNITQTYNTSQELKQAIKQIALNNYEQHRGKTTAYAHNADYDLYRLLTFNEPDIKIIKRSKPAIIALTHPKTKKDYHTKQDFLTQYTQETR